MALGCYLASEGRRWCEPLMAFFFTNFSSSAARTARLDNGHKAQAVPHVFLCALVVFVSC
jgi:hypothetical protein